MTSHKTYGAAKADPNSSISRFIREAREQRAANAARITALMASGLTREQAWSEALKTAS